jgi:uncharacterized coiled-coil protein SlyX
MEKASEAILSLKPVTFRYKTALDPKGIPQFGLVAEDVAKVNPDLVARDEEGKPYTVRHEAVNAMLLNEFLKEHRKVADQSDEIAELKTTVAELKLALKAQAAQIQKVSDQLRTQARAPLVVANDWSICSWVATRLLGATDRVGSTGESRTRLQRASARALNLVVLAKYSLK